MKTTAELKGLAAVSAAAGERIGRIADVLFDGATGQVTGFFVDPDGMFTKPKLLPRALVQSLGADALLVQAGATIEDVTSDPAIAGSFSVHALDGRPVLDQTGKHIGNVAGAFVDEATLTVPALQLKTGFLHNALHGKDTLPLNMVEAIGKDSVLVSNAYNSEAPADEPTTPPAA